MSSKKTSTVMDFICGSRSVMTWLLLVVLRLSVSDKNEEVNMKRAKISNSVEQYE
jgi:hypothetical protein